MVRSSDEQQSRSETLRFRPGAGAPVTRLGGDLPDDAAFGAPAAVSPEPAARPGRAAEEEPRPRLPSSRTPGCGPRPRPRTSASRRRTTSLKAHKYAIERFAQDLLTVRDALELALATPNATIEALQGRRRADAQESQRRLREGAHRRDQPRRREVRPASPPGDDDDRVGSASRHRGAGFPERLPAQ